MYLGSLKQLANISEMLVASTRINVSVAARTLGVVTVCANGRRVSQWLLSATAAPTARQIFVNRGHKKLVQAFI